MDHLGDLVELVNVTKRYGPHEVLTGVSCTVGRGQIMGLIGPNGSGKTTLLRLMAGLVLPTSGTVSLGGVNLRHELGHLPLRVSVAFEPPGVLPNLTGLQNLTLLAAVRGELSSDQVKGWMTKVGLDPKNRRRVAHYSQGMKKRLSLAQALMEAPEVLLLDEPTNGLDPEAQELLSDWLRTEQARGAAIVLAGHDLDQIARLCDPVWKVRQGKLEPASPRAPNHWEPS